MSETKYSITEFANIFDSTRQTLIYYDKMDIFKPKIVLENGYRYYTKDQIREFSKILELRDLDIKLDDIKRIITNRDNIQINAVLDQRLAEINHQIDALNMKKLHLISRKHYHNQEIDNHEIDVPFIISYPDRFALYTQVENVDNDIQNNIDLCYAKAIKNFYQISDLPYGGIGVSFDYQAYKTGKAFNNLKVMIMISNDHPLAKTKVIEANDYLCMYKYGIHSNIDALNKLCHYAAINHYEIIGDILDFCIVDNYYSSNRNDLSCLQVPIKKINNEK